MGICNKISYISITLLALLFATYVYFTFLSLPTTEWKTVTNYGENKTGESLHELNPTFSCYLFFTVPHEEIY